MRTKSSLFLAVIFGIISVFQLNAQQVPNGGFENWIDYGAFEEPEEWQTPNQVTSPLNIFTVEKTTDAIAGNYAARLESKELMGGMFVAPGAVTLGIFEINLVTQTGIITGGIPYNERPEKLKGYFKYFPKPNDFCQFFVLFYKTDTLGQRDTIGTGYFSVNDTVDVWSPFEADIYFVSPQEPDTMNIIFIASYIDNPIAGSTLYIDSVSFDFSTGIEHPETNTEQACLYPNPAAGYVNVILPQNETNAEMQIFNLRGELILNRKICSSPASIDVSSLSCGCYLYRIVSGVKNYHGSLIISR